MPCVESCEAIAASQRTFDEIEDEEIASEVERDIEMATAAVSGEFAALKEQVRKMAAALTEITAAIAYERQHGGTGIPGVWRCFSRIQKAIEEAL